MVHGLPHLDVSELQAAGAQPRGRVSLRDHAQPGGATGGRLGGSRSGRGLRVRRSGRERRGGLGRQGAGPRARPGGGGGRRMARLPSLSSRDDRSRARLRGQGPHAAADADSSPAGSAAALQAPVVEVRSALALLALLTGLSPATLLAPATLLPADDPALVHARQLLAKHPLIDGHNDLPWAIREYEKAPPDVVAYDLRQRTSGHTDFARLKAGGGGGQFWSVYIPAAEKSIGFAKTQLEQMDIARRVIERYPDRLALALTARDIERAMKRGRVASLLGMEGGQAIENSLGALRAFYALGARYMTLTHNSTLDWADAALTAPRHGGLTRLGEEVVREMNRLGMLVDLSHVAPETMDDGRRVSATPAIFLHSSVRAGADHVRNVPDDILERVPANGGVVMVTFVASFVSDELAKASLPLYLEERQRLAGGGDPAAPRENSPGMKARRAAGEGPPPPGGHPPGH